MKKLLAATKLILMLKCEQSTRVVSESLDRDLSAVEWWAVRLHYISCWSCRRFGKHLRMIRDALKTKVAGDDVEGTKLSPAAIKRIESAIQSES